MSENVHRLIIPRRSNEAIDGPLTGPEETAMMAAAARKVEELFDVLRIDHRNDHNTRDTAGRVAKMWVRELLRGRFSHPPQITEFDNIENYDQLILTGPIDLRSMCAHHLMPIYGHVFIGVLPSPEGKIIGLSKYDRIVDHFGTRLQIQEELAKQICSYIEETTSSRGVAIRVSAVHMCKTHRGVKASHSARMVNTDFRGEFTRNPSIRREFLQECLALEQMLRAS
jgi:GTP cyclohydrolase I